MVTFFLRCIMYGIKMAMIDYREADVDNNTLWFKDVLGVKK